MTRKMTRTMAWAVMVAVAVAVQERELVPALVQRVMAGLVLQVQVTLSRTTCSCSMKLRGSNPRVLAQLWHGVAMTTAKAAVVAVATAAVVVTVTAIKERLNSELQMDHGSLETLEALGRLGSLEMLQDRWLESQVVRSLQPRTIVVVTATIVMVRRREALRPSACPVIVQRLVALLLALTVV